MTPEQVIDLLAWLKDDGHDLIGRAIAGIRPGPWPTFNRTLTDINADAVPLGNPKNPEGWLVHSWHEAPDRKQTHTLQGYHHVGSTGPAVAVGYVFDRRGAADSSRTIRVGEPWGPPATFTSGKSVAGQHADQTKRYMLDSRGVPPSMVDAAIYAATERYIAKAGGELRAAVDLAVKNAIDMIERIVVEGTVPTEKEWLDNKRIIEIATSADLLPAKAHKGETLDDAIWRVLALWREREPEVYKALFDAPEGSTDDDDDGHLTIEAIDATIELHLANAWKGKPPLLMTVTYKDDYGRKWREEIDERGGFCRVAIGFKPSVPAGTKMKKNRKGEICFPAGTLREGDVNAAIERYADAVPFVPWSLDAQLEAGIEEPREVEAFGRARRYAAPYIAGIRKDAQKAAEASAHMARFKADAEAKAARIAATKKKRRARV